MVWRSLVIFTRSSRAASSGAEGARGAAGARAAAGAGAAARAASISPLVTRASLPVPASMAGFSPLSAASLATAGPFGTGRRGSRGLSFSLGRFHLGRLGLGASALTGAAAGAALAAPEPSPMEPSSAPTPTVSPSLAMISESTRPRARAPRRDLVGLQLDDRLVGGDGVAGLLEPLADRCLGDRFAQRRNADLGGHARSSSPFAGYGAGTPSGLANAGRGSVQPRASCRNALSCARCLDISPVAVAAEAGRPVLARPRRGRAGLFHTHSR